MLKSYKGKATFEILFLNNLCVRMCMCIVFELQNGIRFLFPT